MSSQAEFTLVTIASALVMAEKELNAAFHAQEAVTDHYYDWISTDESEGCNRTWCGSSASCCSHSNEHSRGGGMYAYSSSCCTEADGLDCITSCAYSSWTIFLAALSIYVSVALVTNLIDCYKFVLAWNAISQARRLDLGILHMQQSQQLRRRQLEQQTPLHRLPDTLQHVHVTAMTHHMSCPICLSDFFEREFVTACDEGGCGNWFHRECLFEWLERSDSCPCCRRDMFLPRPRGVSHWLSDVAGWMADLSAYMGFPMRY